jgi:hypothetical protein
MFGHGRNGRPQSASGKFIDDFTDQFADTLVPGFNDYISRLQIQWVARTEESLQNLARIISLQQWSP